MSRDFQFISVVDDLRVTEVTEVEDAVPRTVRIFGGPGFAATKRVLINDFGIDDFTIVSDRVILAFPPENVFSGVADFEMRAVVISGALTSGRRARIVFEPTLRTRSVSGVQKLVQQVVKELLSDVGSDRFDPSAGGDLVRSLGETLSPSGQSQVSMLLSQAATRVQDNFQRAQARDRRLLPSERLLTLELVDLSFNTTSAEVTATLKLVTFGGLPFELPLIL